MDTGEETKFNQLAQLVTGLKEQRRDIETEQRWTRCTEEHNRSYNEKSKLSTERKRDGVRRRALSRGGEEERERERKKMRTSCVIEEAEYS